MTISKAQLKRNKDLTNALTQKLTRELIDFKERYLTDYRDFFVNQQILKRTKIETLLLDNARLYKYATERRFNNVDQCIKSLRGQVAKINDNLNRKSTFDFVLFSEANESFQTKFNNLILKLVDYQISTRFLKVTRAGNGSRDKFSILITNDEVEVEARFIYACGEINTPHYRFIITKRDI